MDERGPARRLLASLTTIFLLAACAVDVSPTPAPTPPTASASLPPSAAPAATPAPSPTATPASDVPGAPGSYYVAPSGSDTNPGTSDLPWLTIQHAADLLTAGQTVFIRAGTYREHVRPANSGAAGAPITYAAYPGEIPRVDGATVVLPDGQSGLFEVRDRAWITVVGLRIANAGPGPGSNGILVAQSHDVVLEGNQTESTRSSGIGVWGSSRVVVRGNEIVNACLGGSQESLTVAGTDTFLVEDNTVRDAGPEKEGIDVKDGSAHGVIRGNRVSNIPAVGIYVDAWDKATSDIEVSGNTVVQSGNGIALASEMGGLLSNVRIVNNVVTGSTWFGIVITRNGDDPAVLHHPITGIAVVNNTVWRNGDPWGGGIGVDNPDAKQVIVRNNIASGNTSFQLSLSSDVPEANVIIEYNLVDGYRGDLSDGEIYGVHHIEGDPRFSDAADGDFQLGEGSAAIDTGTSTGAPPTDFDGRARPHGAGYDIGAFESGSP